MPQTRRSTPSSPGTFADRAYRAIRRDIINGRYTLGHSLSSRAIATELGISFLPVLSALQRLQEEGLVESRPRVGTRVVLPTEEHVLGMHQVREALECQAARLCAERASPEQRTRLARLAAQVDETDACLVGDDVPRAQRVRAHKLHARLHLSIARFADCPHLLDAIERSQVLTFKIQLDNADRRRALPQYRHTELIGAIVSGEPDEADAAMRRHLRAALPGTLSLIRNVARSRQWRRPSNQSGPVRGHA